MSHIQDVRCLKVNVEIESPADNIFITHIFCVLYFILQYKQLIFHRDITPPIFNISSSTTEAFLSLGELFNPLFIQFHILCDRLATVCSWRSSLILWPQSSCFKSLDEKCEGQKDTDRLDRVGMRKVEMDLEEVGWMGGRELDPSG